MESAPLFATRIGATGVVGSQPEERGFLDLLNECGNQSATVALDEDHVIVSREPARCCLRCLYAWGGGIFSYPKRWAPPTALHRPHESRATTVFA